LRSKKTSPEGIFIRIQGGFGWKRSAAAGAATAPSTSSTRSLRDRVSTMRSGGTA
jgi:hypothetical protein